MRALRSLEMVSALVLAATLGAGCAGGTDRPDSFDPSNPFLADQSRPGKADTAYVNPDGVEVEVDLEADVDPEPYAYRLWDGPAELGQYALTYLRKHGQVYLESLAEDAASQGRAEWLIGGEWLSTEQAKQRTDVTPRHFRLRGVNAVLLFGAATDAQVGRKLPARVPFKPFTMMNDFGESCADRDDHLGLDQSIYWYQWNPDKEGCQAPLQDMSVTISKTLAGKDAVYPEYDRLVADGKLTVVVLFGQIGDGEISDSDAGMVGARQMASWLADAGFAEASPAPVGRRFSKLLEKSGVTVEFDLYSPHEFSGLSDSAHYDNFQKAIGEHEIVVYDGHSMLGASDFWARPAYPDSYQIFLYGGCLGYEYYVRPILAGKKGWQNVDILSSVVEVSVGANEFAAPALAKMVWALDNNYQASWRDLVLAVREQVGDSTFGVSGARDNCFTPQGSRCTQ